MLHIFTYCTDKDNVKLLEKSAQLKNIRLQIIYEPQSEYKGFTNKIFKMKEAILQNENILENDMILFVDAYDVLCFAGSEQEIMDKFHSYNCELLMGAEMNSYPYGYDDKYPPAGHNPTNYKYINSGGFIGYKSAIVKLYSWKTDAEIIHICSDGGDQTYFIQYYLAHYNNDNHVKMDYNQSIFQNMFLVSWYDFVIKNGRLYNTILKQYPCFIHFNGLSYQTDTNANIMEVFVDKLTESILESEFDKCFDFIEYKKSTWPNPTIIPQLQFGLLLVPVPILHIFTYSTDTNSTHLLEKSAQLKNIRLQIIYEPQSEYKGHKSKIFKMREAIQHLDEKDMILFVDAYDVLCFAGSEQEIMDKFYSYDCDLLIGSEMNSFPDGYDDKYPPAGHNPTNYKYINSGGFIGYKSALMQLYSWKNDDEISDICSYGGDQHYFIQYYLAHYDKNVKMDYNQSIFQNMYQVCWYDFVIKNGRLYNTILDQYPCFMHFSGNTYTMDTNENLMYPLVEILEQSISNSNPEEVYTLTEYKRAHWQHSLIPQLRN